MPILLQVHNLKKSYDIEPLFDDLVLSVEEKKHIGLVGRNGAGKSTLFKIIMGEEVAESGEVQIHPDTRIGYLRQQNTDLDFSKSVMDYLVLSSGKESWECAKMAGQFDLKNEQLEQTIGSFSGGYQIRVKLVAMLLDDPNLLLLDEPTNYLDLSTLLLLETFLRQFNGSFLLITHDREFLKRTCDNTLEIEQGKATYYPQPLEAYLAHKVTQAEFARRYNKKIAKEQRHLQDFVDRFRYKASKASQAQSKLKQLNKLRTMSINTALGTASIILPQVEEIKGEALSLTGVSMGYSDKIVAEDIHFSVQRGEHVAIVGDNGQGKTTLLKTIAGALPELAGNIKMHHRIRMGYYAQHVPEMLNSKDTVESHLIHSAGTGVPDEQVLKMASNFLFRDHDLKKSISVLSGGEKARLCLAGLLLQNHDMLLLDEPTNHLDFETVEALAAALAKSHMTILFVSHDRTFVSSIATSVIEVGGEEVRRSFHDYDNYIYHLKRKLAIREELVEAEKTPESEKKEARRVAHEALKEQKKLLQKTELDISELEKKKQELFDWFEENSTSFSRIKQDELDSVQYELDAAEREWLGVQGSVEELEDKLTMLRE
jgi:ATP-binding cassette, subfamily F, member 3